MSSLPIAITCGDPSGVGPEVISAWLSSCRESLNNYCFIGPAQWLDALSAVNKMVVGNGSYVLTPGKPSLEGAKIAFDALRIAAEGCVNKQFSGVVTGPATGWLPLPRPNGILCGCLGGRACHGICRGQASSGSCHLAHSAYASWPVFN